MTSLAIVTGATSGLGWHTALGLARVGHDVLLTGRDEGRGAAALARLEAQGATGGFALLDVSSLASVRTFAASIDRPVSVLVNNAGVMALPRRELTVDGFERQFATNHLGHFTLVAALLDRLRGGRVVAVSSVAHRRGRIAIDDLNAERRYDPWAAYAQSKLANLMFALELQQRSTAGEWGIHALAAHPGWAATEIITNGMGAKAPGLKERLLQAAFSAAGQSAANGARPLIHAAIDPGALATPYWGPCCWNETRGRPAPARIEMHARDGAMRTRLWDASEALTGAGYPAAR